MKFWKLEFETCGNSYLEFKYNSKMKDCVGREYPGYY